MTPEITANEQPFTGKQLETLHFLRSRYQQNCDLFSDNEQTHLHFVRWLYRSGRLDS